MAPAVGWPAGGSSVGLELELGRLMGPSSDSVYLTAHSIHLTASIPQSPDRREFGQQLFGGSEVEHPAGMHHPDAAAQLLEDAGLGGVWPAAGAAVAAGVAAPDRVDRPWILPSRRARRRACTSSIRFWIAVAVNSGLGIRRASLRRSHADFRFLAVTSDTLAQSLIRWAGSVAAPRPPGRTPWPAPAADPTPGQASPEPAG